MFYIENGTKIVISRGDTGAFIIHTDATMIDTEEPYVFGERDRAVFTIKSGTGDVLKEKAYQVSESGDFMVVFLNADTQDFDAGTNYSWDVRYVINPYYREPAPSGNWPDYSELTFPVSSGDTCMHGGTYYVAITDISTAEEWNPEHWMCVDYRIPVDGDQVITDTTPLEAQLLAVVGEI